jgi:hypothetical protein
VETPGDGAAYEGLPDGLELELPDEWTLGV